MRVPGFHRRHGRFLNVLGRVEVRLAEREIEDIDSLGLEGFQACAAAAIVADGFNA